MGITTTDDHWTRLIKKTSQLKQKVVIDLVQVANIRTPRDAGKMMQTSCVAYANIVIVCRELQNTNSAKHSR